MDNRLSFGVTEYVRDLRWMARLSDGSSVYQDDGRPDVELKSAWLRLKRHVLENDLDIVSLQLEFRSHIVPISTKVESLFFCHSVGADLAFSTEGRSFRPIGTYTHFLVGTLNPSGDAFDLRSYLTPELEVVRAFDRPLEKCNEECVILSREKRNYATC